MKIQGELNSNRFAWLDAASDAGCKIEGQVGSSRLVGTQSVKFNGDDYGEWYLIGGYCLQTAMIRAGCEQDAWEIYLEEFVPCDEPENEDELEYGSFDSVGGWYSEVTCSYIMFLDPHDYDEWDIEIKKGDD